MSKDLFSKQAGEYAAGRPGYPPELFEYILSFVKGRDAAWDCATGNGQAAAALSPFFNKIEATDLSSEQIARAKTLPNVTYHVCSADRTPFADESFDLITVATAYHWLQPQSFAAEAGRVGKKGAVVAAWAYNLLQTENGAIQTIIQDFYFRTIHSYWDAERRHVEEYYANVDFPFSPLPSRDFSMTLSWDRERFTNYLKSWSAVQHYVDANGRSPLLLIEEDVNRAWPKGAVIDFTFPLFLRIGTID